MYHELCIEFTVVQYCEAKDTFCVYIHKCFSNLWKHFGTATTYRRVIALDFSLTLLFAWPESNGRKRRALRPYPTWYYYLCHA